MPSAATTKTLETPTGSKRSSPTTTLRIAGMTCGNCARHVTEALQSVAGVQLADVTLQTGQGLVRWAPDAQAQPQKLIRAVEEAGFSAEPVEPATQRARSHSLESWTLNLWLGALVTFPLMIGEWVLGL